MNPINGWLCDLEDAPFHSWVSDVPWFEANRRHGHEYLISHKDGVMHKVTILGSVTKQNFRTQLFYGNPIVRPHEMFGLSELYSTRDAGKAQNAVCVLDGGGAQGGASVWVIGWGPRAIYMVTPDGLPPVAGGEVAIVIADWRFAVRIANIDADCEQVAALVNLALARLPTRIGDRRNVRPVIYANAATAEKLDASIRGVFVRVMDDIRSDEPRVD